MSEPHPGAIAGISSEQFAENARAIGEAVGLSADESVWQAILEPPPDTLLAAIVGPELAAEAAAWLNPSGLTYTPNPDKPGFTIDSEGSES